jgi:hypothetical protein
MTARSTSIAPAALVLGLAAGSAHAFPFYLSQFQATYPTTTIPDRMFNTLGVACWTCHHPEIYGQNGNCYREDLKVMLASGSTIQQALNAIDRVDSDGDGVPNGVEILTARLEPGQIGYNPGLTGPLGGDPCFEIPGAQVSGQLETPPVYCAANCDRSTIAPILNAGDFTCFLNNFRAAASLPAAVLVKHYANCDNSTIAPVLNAGDFTCFLNKFRAGCP